jgi:hypothetical protein
MTYTQLIKAYQETGNQHFLDRTRTQKEENTMINFNTSVEETRLINAITKRTVQVGVCADLLALEMDITATHKNGNPLRLAELLAADEFNFWHDINGIQNNINRKTGKLENCFVPRFSAPSRSKRDKANFQLAIEHRAKQQLSA